MRRRRASWWWLVVALVVCAAAAVVARSRLAARGPGPAGPGRAAASGQASGAARPVPVLVATAARRDVPVYLEGLGSVVANRTVTVRPLVDGTLQQVSFDEGRPVRQGQLLAQIDPRPFQAQLDQARGALLRDQAQLRAAQLNVGRDRRLVGQNLIASQQLDNDLALEGQLEGAVRIDQAAIETAQLNLSYTRIVSPVDGVAGIRAVDPGNVVHASDPGGIVVVTQLDPVGVLFALPQDDLTRVAQQLARGPLPVDVFSRDGTVLLGRGRLQVIDNEINAATSTIRLKAMVPNAQRLLWPNEFVNVRVELEVERGALVIPAPAVQRGPNGTLVWVVDAGRRALERPIQLERTQGDLAVVAGGLQAGAEVVVEGQNQLRSGAPVAPRPTPQAAPAAGAPVARDGTAQGGTGGGTP